jgi:hypothetical protein
LTDVFNRTLGPRGIQGARKRRGQAAPRANGSTRQVVSTNARYNARVNDGGQSKKCAGEKLRKLLRRAPSACWQDGSSGRIQAGVVPVRQKNYSKVDYCNCPRHMPLS